MPIDHCIACNGTDLYSLHMVTFGPVVLKKSPFALARNFLCEMCGQQVPGPISETVVDWRDSRTT
jgi:hypothetical protein